MPKRQRSGPRRSRRRNSGRRPEQTVVVHFHAINSVTLTAGAASQVVGPYSGFSSRASSISDVFDEYRVTALKYRVRVDAGVSANATSMAFYPGITTTLPNTVLQLGENEYVSMRQVGDDVIPPYITVPRSVCAGEQSWYKCQKSTLTADDSVPGQLIFFGTSTDSILYELDAVIEFRGEADPANTPLARQLELKAALERSIPLAYEREHRSKLQQRQQLLTLLNYTETESITKWPSFASSSLKK